MTDSPDTSDKAQAEEAAATVSTGPDVIAAFGKQLPDTPGVYRMLNANGDVLYVGKAKKLKSRVSNYTRMGGQTNRIAAMISQTASMEFVTTRTETEALLLEANLIKRLRPRYNVLLRDDKSFPYIMLTKDHEAPMLAKHRGARKGDADYFGPFASAGSVNRTINALQRAFLLRTCTDSVYASRTRPCLLYQIKRCAGPCTGEVSEETYADYVKEAKAFLSGRSTSVREDMGRAMQEASEQLDFETAAVYRDRLSALSHVQSHQGINPQGIEEADVFALHEDSGQCCIEVFFIRTGQNWGNRAYYPKADNSHEAPDILQSFIAQFYDDKPVPRLVLVSHDLPEQDLLREALSEKAERKVELSRPQRGNRRDLVAHASKNAKDALGRRMAESASHGKLLKGLADAFDLEAPPRRVEIYDNSHVSGTNAVGVMVVADGQGLAKNQYRKFNIKSEDTIPGDDFGMMREVFSRRFARLLKEHGLPETSDDKPTDDTPAWPELVLIDGGAGQLSAVREVMDELGLLDVVPLVGVAKGPERDAGRETFYMDGRDPFMLQPRDPVLYFIQRLRDEAHRFAIGTHRAKRSKALVANPLDDIPGIGPSRKRALLQMFGSAKSVARAAQSDLAKVEGISDAMAQAIYDHFHSS